MSYVDLKHALADLALEAVQHPDRAAWAGILAAYGAAADAAAPAVTWETLLAKAQQLGTRLGWRLSRKEVTRLIEAGVLERDGEMFRISPRYLPHLEYLQRQSRRLLEALVLLRRAAPMSDGVRRGAALFDAGLFFECHEYLEAIWKATDGPAKHFYHGIVQVSAAFYHYEKGNRHGASTLLGKGLRKLESYPAEYLGVDLAAFRQALAPWGRHFAERDPGDKPSVFPTILPGYAGAGSSVSLLSLGNGD